MLPGKSVHRSTGNLLEAPGFKVLPSAVIYGSNGAGKSNLLKGLLAMEQMVLYPGSQGEPLRYYQPFKLNHEGVSEPVYFKIEFLSKSEIRYTYEIAFNEREVITENLYFYPSGSKAKLFERKAGNDFKFGESFKGPKKELIPLLYPNQLFLSKVESLKIQSLLEPYLFFKEGYNLFLSLDGLQTTASVRYLVKKFNDSSLPHFKDNLNRIIAATDTGIGEISYKLLNPDDIVLPANIPDEFVKQIKEQAKHRLLAAHKFTDGNGQAKTVEFDIAEESTGTRILLETGSLILEALYLGYLLVIDEFNQSLHPRLTKALLKIFNNPETNPNKAQLLITTHDQALLDSEIFSTDQIWIAEKEHEGNTCLYALSDINGIRKNTPFAKWYGEGVFGGVPVINEMNLVFNLD